MQSRKFGQLVRKRVRVNPSATVFRDGVVGEGDDRSNTDADDGSQDVNED